MPGEEVRKSDAAEEAMHAMEILLCSCGASFSDIPLNIAFCTVQQFLVRNKEERKTAQPFHACLIQCA